MHKAHDHFFRSFMSEIAIAKSFFKLHLPPNILEIVDLEALVLCKESYVDKDLEEKVVDMLYMTKFKDRTGYIYTLVEHQSSVDHLMALRIFEYMLKILRHHQSINPEDKLPRKCNILCD